MNFRLRVLQTGGAPNSIQSVMLRCQIRIEPARRKYDAFEVERLHDLFNAPERWRDTMRPLLWTQTTTVLRPFDGMTVVDLPVPCSFDFSRAATKYFDALHEGEIPLCFLFSGTVFYDDAERGLQVMQIPWEKEAYFRLPAAVWRAMMDRHYPEGIWLCLGKNVFDRLSQYRGFDNHPSWDQAIEALLEAKHELATT